ARGHAVRFVSVTNGDRGHHEARYKSDPSALALRRLGEARAAAAIIGADYRTLGVRDGEVTVDHASTEAMVRCIRSFGRTGIGPDLVVFNRTIDYHRDHRNTAQLVVDATYLLTVPTFCTDTPHLARMPVFATWYDDFRDEGVFRADVSVGIDDEFEAKVDMVCAHASQFFEWLPYNAGVLDQVPTDPAGRRSRVWEILERRAVHRGSASAEAPTRIAPSERAEAFQLCEYGRVPDDTEARELFAAEP
ncbi:MAG: PIG-L deacetylase family protein, partial [Armatimonadota bacterium]